MSLYRLARPLLGLISPENAHSLTVWALARGFGPIDRAPDEPILQTTLWGRSFRNPIGLAAGFDKHAGVMTATLGLGFGFVEVGSITPKPQPGNPRPRVFRLKASGAVINRYGFNSGGVEAAAKRLADFRAGAPALGPVGVNLGKNKDSADAAADYAEAAKRLARFADYLVVNVSSPNTPGLRALQDKAELTAIIAAVRTAMPDPAPPLVLKIAPDLTLEDKRDIAAVALDERLDGLIVSNTTVERDGLAAGDEQAGEQAGGLSGLPLFVRSTALLAEMYDRTAGKIPLIGTGGIATADHAYAKIRAGASLVQLYTALVFAGPELIPTIKHGLAERLRKDGYANVAEAVGADHR